MTTAGNLNDFGEPDEKRKVDYTGILQDLQEMNAQLEGKKYVKKRSYGRVVNGRSKKPRAPAGGESHLDISLIRYEVDNFAVYTDTKLISFTKLPVYIDGVTPWCAIPSEKVFVEGKARGKAGRNGNFKHRVDMWSLTLHPVHMPQFHLKTEKGEWVTLLNPTDGYTKIMNSIYALGHFLNFVKKFPNESTTAAEKDLRKMCRMHKSKPKLDSLSQHIAVIRNFIQEDDEFAKAPVLKTIFPNLFPENSSPERADSQDPEYDPDTVAGVKRKSGSPSSRSESTKKKKKDDTGKPSESLQWRNDGSVTEDDGSVTEDVSETEDDFNRKGAQRAMFTRAETDVEDPPICVLCDEGGDLLYCDGPCHRHFHHTEASGVHSDCETLRLSAAVIEDMIKYYCPNCEHEKQQCFSCGELGSTVSTVFRPPEVRCCEVAFCHKFFHSDCAATALMCESSTAKDWRSLSEGLYNGLKKLYCPRHRCSVCGKTEMKEPGLLIQCRRCPKAWHRECLLDFSRSKELQSTKIWKHADRGFIYCREHEIIPQLETPARTHVTFPDRD